MNKKILALLIVAVLIIGGYAAFYVFQSLYAIPEDVKVFKDELKSIENAPIPEKDIKELETLANQIENGPSLKIIPKSERTKMANDMRNDPFFTSINSTVDEIKQNVTNNLEIASRYDLLLKGDVANNIRGIYSQKLISLAEDMQKIIEKIPNNFENGDNTALANDLRELARLGREMNTLAAQNKGKLNDIIKSLEG